MYTSNQSFLIKLLLLQVNHDNKWHSPRMYDYGLVGNLQHYHSAEPPMYNVGNMTTYAVEIECLNMSTLFLCSDPLPQSQRQPGRSHRRKHKPDTTTTEHQTVSVQRLQSFGFHMGDRRRHHHVSEDSDRDARTRGASVMISTMNIHKAHSSLLLCSAISDSFGAKFGDVR